MSADDPVPPGPRRAELLHHMRHLASEGKSCAACSGVCCTFVANSMRITRAEALDMRESLQAQGRWNSTLFEQLRECVRRYRLDHEPGDGRRSLRRTYTCPFFAGTTLGCTLPPTHKPYGCLAFNPRRSGLTEGGDCASDQSLLRRQAEAFPDADPFPPLPIPLALLALLAPPPHLP